MSAFESKIERLPAVRVVCTVTFTKERVQSAEAEALARLGGELKLPGFRPGKAPEELVRERVGTDRILEETIHILLPDTFHDLLKIHGIKPIIHPKVELQLRDPLTLRITFTEHPLVTLNGIESIRIEKKEPKVDAKDVDRVVEALLRQEGIPLPLTDDHAKKFGIADAQKLREQIEKQLRREEETIEKQRREQLLLDRIREATVVELAPELIDEEERVLEHEVHDELERANLTLQDFLKQQGKEHNAFQKELRERAARRLRLRLGLQTLVEERGPEIPDEEMTKLTHVFLGSVSPEERAKLEPRLTKGADLYEQLRWRRRVDKTIDQLLTRPLHLAAPAQRSPTGGAG